MIRTGGKSYLPILELWVPEVRARGKPGRRRGRMEVKGQATGMQVRKQKHHLNFIFLPMGSGSRYSSLGVSSRTRRQWPLSPHPSLCW